MLTKQGRLDQALPWWEKAVEEGDQGNRLAGILARRRGDLAVAEKYFEVVADWDSDGSARTTLQEIRDLLRQVNHQH
ncbi:hypothetical protein AB0C13_08470 [Streptomyces sp. NPDC049099]|uniref:hypothetical protein n=1 Tax=Streptomyces sp. NPDC049099 TaxID=3155768 RepID=UPI003425210D